MSLLLAMRQRTGKLICPSCSWMDRRLNCFRLYAAVAASSYIVASVVVSNDVEDGEDFSGAKSRGLYGTEWGGICSLCLPCVVGGQEYVYGVIFSLCLECDGREGSLDGSSDIL